MLAAYGVGAISYARNYWPIDKLRGMNRPAVGTFDAEQRLVSYPGKIAVACPSIDTDTAVILAIGQSNAGNHGEELYQSKHPAEVVNYFDGRCYQAASPLLGASGGQGEFITMVADQLIDAGRYHRAVIVAGGVTMSGAARWEQGGDLNDVLGRALDALPASYRFTQVLWMQGERDFEDHTTAAQYATSFRSLLATLDGRGIDAPVYIGITSRCLDRDRWTPDNPITAAQRSLIDGRRVFLGADTDALLGDADRRADHCHLNGSGQHKAATAFAEAIQQHEARR